MHPRLPTASAVAPPADPTARSGEQAHDIAYLTRYVGKVDTGIAFTDRAYLDGLARSTYSTLVVGNGMAPVYPADGLTYTTSVAEYRRSRPRLHVVNGLGSYVAHLRMGYLPEHAAGHKVAVMHEEPAAFDFYDTDVWNRRNVRDVLMAAQDGFVFVSERSRALWVDEAGLRDVPAHVLPNTCAEEQSIAAELADRDPSEIARQLGFEPESLHLVVVGSVQRLKAQHDVVEAVRRVRGARPDLAVHLHVVGRARNAAYADELAALVSARGLSGTVSLVGAVPKRRALEYVAAADALVLASHTEAMPLVLLEAMLLGTPVLTTAVGGVPEILDQTSAGFFDVGDVDGLAALVERVVDDREWSSGLAQAARARYWSAFSNARFRERFERVLQDVTRDAGLTTAPAVTGTTHGDPTVERRPDGVLSVTGAPGAGSRRWRAVLAAEHARAPLGRVELAVPDGDLVSMLTLAAPLARLGLAVTEVSAPGGSLVCAPGEDGSVLSASQILRIVGAPHHESAYGEHVRAAARRRAKAAGDAAPAGPGKSTASTTP